MLTECIVAQLDIYSVELMALTTIDSDCARQRGQKDTVPALKKHDLLLRQTGNNYDTI